MSLSDLASIGSLVSGVAVTVSLIYLIIQTRQNVRHTRALIVQGMAARTTAIISNPDPNAMAVWIEGNGGTATKEAIKKATASASGTPRSSGSGFDECRAWEARKGCALTLKGLLSGRASMSVPGA